MQLDIYKLQRGSGQPHVYPKSLKKIKIPILDSTMAKNKLKEIEKIEKNRSKYLIASMSQLELDKIVMIEIGKILKKDLT